MCQMKDAEWFTVTVNEDEMVAKGYEKKRQARDELDKRFQEAIPEELTRDYLESLCESTKESLDSGWYVNPDEYTTICRMYSDAEARDFCYGDAYTSGSHAFYMPDYEFGMMGNVFSRNELADRFVVFWNGEEEIHHAEYKTKQEAEKKLQEVFLAATPEDILEKFKEGISKMDLEEDDVVLFDDVAYCALSSPPFNAILVDINAA